MCGSGGRRRPQRPSTQSHWLKEASSRSTQPGVWLRAVRAPCGLCQGTGSAGAGGGLLSGAVGGAWSCQVCFHPAQQQGCSAGGAVTHGGTPQASPHPQCWTSSAKRTWVGSLPRWVSWSETELCHPHAVQSEHCCPGSKTGSPLPLWVPLRSLRCEKRIKVCAWRSLKRRQMCLRCVGPREGGGRWVEALGGPLGRARPLWHVFRARWSR